MDASMPGGLNVMLHISDKHRLLGLQAVLLENLVNFLPLIPDIHIGLFKETRKTRHFGLNREMVVMDRTQKKTAQLVGSAKVEELARMGQRTDGILDLPKSAMKPSFELGKRDMRNMPVVKTGEWETE